MPGDPSTPSDLGIVNIDDARSVVILGDDDGDAEVVKTVLALAARDTAIGRANVVAEVSDPRTARAIEASFGTDVLTVQSTEVVARVTAQSCRQAGLSVVVQELLDFDGAEIYFTEQPSLVGKTFYEAQLSFVDSMVMGLVQNGAARLHPASDTVIAAGDSLIVIAEDDDTIKLAVEIVAQKAA